MPVITHAPTSCPRGRLHQPLRPLSSVPLGPEQECLPKECVGLHLVEQTTFHIEWQPGDLSSAAGKLGPGPLSLLIYVSFEECSCLSILLCFRIQRDQGNHSETSWRGQNWSVSPPGPSCPASLLASPLKHTTGLVERWGCGFFLQFGARSWPPVLSLRKLQSTVTLTKDVGVPCKGAVREVSWLSLPGRDRGTRR